MGIADNPRNTGKRGEFLGSALGVAAGDDEEDGRILRVNLSNGVAGLGIGGSGYGAGVEDDDGRRGRVGGGGKAAIEELAFDGGAVGLRGAAAELLDEEGGHLL